MCVMREGRSVLGEPVLLPWMSGRGRGGATGSGWQTGPRRRSLCPGPGRGNWEVEELVSGPWGSRAHSAYTEGRWEAPGNVPHRGHRTMLWWNIRVAVIWRTDPA
ncbi:hypothetical protein VZT92_008448 [Zoarces viviparus]|uniref:Uncharacterized protein n=1 Tax=Zoarces viviparus TaxID=48416 RepID=A0AAW1FEM4_ZOAVI